jgi:hypothetical protein
LIGKNSSTPVSSLRALIFSASFARTAVSVNLEREPAEVGITDNADGPTSRAFAALTKPDSAGLAALVSSPARGFKIGRMNDEALKAAVGRFLKNVSFKAQSEIEKVVRTAVATGKLQSCENLTAAVTLSSEKLDLNITIFSKIDL